MKEKFTKYITYTTSLLLLAAMFTGCVEEEDQTDPDKLIVGFTFETEQNSLVVVFANNSENAVSYEWDFGDGKYSTEAAPTYEYVRGGTYTVYMTAVHTDGSEKIMSDNITVATASDMSIDFTTEVDGFAVTFTNVSTGAASYEWVFGEESTVSTDANPVYIYRSDGTFTVTLTGIDASGNEAVITKEVTILPQLVVGFTLAIEDLTVTFTNTSENAVSYSWNFGDGSPASTEENPVYTYSAGGTFNVTLTGTNAADNMVSATTEVNVVAPGPTIKTFSLFSEREDLSFGNQVIAQSNNAYTNLGPTTAEFYEGTQSMYFDFDNIDTWGTQGSLLADGNTADISEFANGTYHVALKTTCDKTMLIRLHTNSGGEEVAILTLDPTEEPYGLKRDGEWYALEIPVQDFVTANPNIDLTKVTHLFVFRSNPDAAVSAADDFDWYLDDLYLSVEIDE